MIPGPVKLVRCPLCAQLGRYDTVTSGNTFGARYYTDGKRIAPMLPQVPAVVTCPKCRGAFWLKKAEEVGTYDYESSDQESFDPVWTTAVRLREPDEAGYLDWMDRLLASNREDERDVRVMTWWRGNDRHRESQSAQEEVRSEHVMMREANMRALLGLLSADMDADNLMRAEILRQLGDFDSALTVLSLPFPKNLRTAVRLLRSLCEAGERQLRELK